MSHASVQDFRDRIDDQVTLELTTRDNGASADEQVIQRALDDASSVIDGYLERVPTEDRPSPAVLVPYCVDIAVYRLMRNRPGREFESVVGAYKAALSFLAAVAQGRYPVTPKADGESSAAFQGGPRTFSRDSMGGF